MATERPTSVGRSIAFPDGIFVRKNRNHTLETKQARVFQNQRVEKPLRCRARKSATKGLNGAPGKISRLQKFFFRPGVSPYLGLEILISIPETCMCESRFTDNRQASPRPAGWRK